MGRAVIFITHNPHHAYPVGDRFVLLKRGRMLGSYSKAETTLEQLTSLMAGGAELEELSHELQRAADPELKEVAKELAADAAAEAQTPA
jgi:simple sugar transport system ATP-binding protein